MIKINSHHSFSLDNVLFSFALASEAADVFEGYHTLITGIGKVNAAYVLAMIAMKEQIPFLCLKYISDGADDDAAEDWTVQVHKAALAYGKILKL